MSENSTDLIHDDGRLDPLSSPVIRAVQPLLDVRPKERHNIEMMRGTVEIIGTIFYHPTNRTFTHLVAKEEKISSKVFVLLYSANISSIGTSGVGWFIDPSSNGFCASSRSVRNNGICVSTKSETISRRLSTNHCQRCSQSTRTGYRPQYWLRICLVELLRKRLERVAE